MKKIQFKNILKTILFYLLIAPSLIIGYGHITSDWWQFIPSTVLLLVLGKIFFPFKWQDYLGIKGSYKDITYGIFFIIIFTIISYKIISLSLPDQYKLVNGCLLDYLLPPFQTFNEEIVFRGILLSGLMSLGISKWKIIIIPALFFSILHYIFYLYNIKSINAGSIDLSAIITLFFFGVTANVLYISTKSVILPWSLHCAWNFNRFGSRIIRIDTPSVRVLEYHSFNLLEGSVGVLILSFLLSLLAIFLMHKREGSKEKSLLITQ